MNLTNKDLVRLVDELDKTMWIIYGLEDRVEEMRFIISKLYADNITKNGTESALEALQKSMACPRPGFMATPKDPISE